MKQTHGKVEDRQPTNLHAILGSDGFGFYRTSNPAEYEAYIEGLVPDMLDAHAEEAGVMPVDNRTLLIDGLMTKFYTHWHDYGMGKETPDEIPGHKQTLYDIMDKK